MKECRACLETKELSLFVKQKSSKGGYENTCKSCSAKRNREWKQANKEKVAGWNKKYSLANPEKVKESKDKWKKENPEFLREVRKKWRDKNKGLVNSYTRKRQASQLQRTPAWLTDFDNTYIECMYQLSAMRSKYSGEKWHVDHVIPLQGKLVSGLHVPLNLKVVPATYNSRKYNSYEIQ